MRAAPDRCPACDYPLTDLPDGRCPECGAPYTHAALRACWRSRSRIPAGVTWGLTLVALLTLGASVLYPALGFAGSAGLDARAETLWILAVWAWWLLVVACRFANGHQEVLWLLVPSARMLVAGSVDPPGGLILAAGGAGLAAGVVVSQVLLRTGMIRPILGSLTFLIGCAAGSSGSLALWILGSAAWTDAHSIAGMPRVPALTLALVLMSGSLALASLSWAILGRSLRR